ncbi:acyloxyacyl hydrolase [Flavobacterium sharifuzzamanii]|uniref:acyloxyacyl hydrolase n=1 Tax=Flavobacterium sharifuzzamanii TaxID=2211133 RepID=UPI000DAE860A|nr:acyloxyacyl hydrolase [Flavobacterium sharifuzzamanii]KAF2081883.1 acyloxyacyl hydrolase [Flavobacterium sharifuzzamanii]
MKGKLLLGILLLLVLKMTAQEHNSRFSLGLNYGFGSEFSNTDYSFENHFYKVQFYYEIKETRNFKYEILVQPEINFGKHQLLNFYFVKPETPNYQQKRDEYTRLKDVREYVLNCGFLVRRPIGKVCAFYVLGSIGPMITDTETERMSKGFAFADVFALGFSVDYNKFRFDVRPSVRHVSNASLGSSNAGYNTKNIEFGISYQL